jgi:hypothetical protein
VPQTYGLKTTPLPEKFRQSGVFDGRVFYGWDVQFCARLCPECRHVGRISVSIRSIRVRQSVAVRWSECCSLH